MSDFFFLIMVACFVVSFVQSFFIRDRSSQRRIYWSCAVVAAIAGLLSAQPDWRRGLGFALVVLGVMTVMAYAYTPYIRVRGKVYAMTLQNNNEPHPEGPTTENLTYTTDLDQDAAPDSYSGLLSATKIWWMIVGLMVISSGNTIAFATGKGEWWVAGIGIAFLVFLAATTGYGDASSGYGIARGQHIQFGIGTLITAGAFAVLYLAAYQAAKRLRKDFPANTS